MRRLQQLAWAATMAAVLLLPSSASAQSVGVRVGASADPDQFYFGAHLETPPVVEGLYFRPNAEIGIGSDLNLVALNFELVYKFSSQRAWTVYAGGGPALNLIFTERRDHAEGGLNVLGGVEHRGGFFVEVKLGAMDSPDFKIGVGIRLR